MRPVRRSAVNPLALRLAAAVLLATAAPAQDWPETSPVFRYREDYSFLRDGRPEDGPFLADLKGIQLDDQLTLTLGGHVRYRSELIRNDNWGLPEGSDDDALIGLRAFGHADLRYGDSVRGFVELIAAIDAIGDGPTAPPDEDSFDLLQGFGELDDGDVMLRLGRQLIELGTGRLIATRYGVNVPRPFDAARFEWSPGDLSFGALVGSPVVTRAGVFDDGPADDEWLWSLNASWEGEADTVDLFYIGYDEQGAGFPSGTASQIRHTIGSQWTGRRDSDRSGEFVWDLEAFIQLGAFGSQDIFAWSTSAKVQWTPLESPLTLGLKADLISGDDDPTDGELGTFDPLFPKGLYFGDLTLVGPSNLIHLDPELLWQIDEEWSAELSTALYWRQNLGDGIQGIAGNTLRPVGGSRSRFIGFEPELTVNWEPNSQFSLSSSVTAFAPGDFVRDTGPAETVVFWSLEFGYWF